METINFKTDEVIMGAEEINRYLILFTSQSTREDSLQSNVHKLLIYVCCTRLANNHRFRFQTPSCLHQEKLLQHFGPRA